MPCYTFFDKDRNRIGTLCGNLGPHCADCGSVSDNLCDFPVGDDKTCDRPICDHHSHEVAPNMHYCKQHHKEWLAFVESGGVKAALENVVPYSTKGD